MIWIILIAILINTGLAFYDSYRMKNNYRISHGVNAGVYVILCVITALLFGNIWYAVPMLLIRPVVFDPVLNMANNLNPFHQSMTTTSIMDKMERKLFGSNGFLPWLMYLILFAVSVILIT